jgi:hypothetical protein
VSTFDDPARREREHDAYFRRLPRMQVALIRMDDGVCVEDAAVVMPNPPRERKHVDRKHGGLRRPRYERTRGRD